MLDNVFISALPFLLGILAGLWIDSIGGEEFENHLPWYPASGTHLAELDAKPLEDGAPIRVELKRGYTYRRTESNSTPLVG